MQQATGDRGVLRSHRGAVRAVIIVERGADADMRVHDHNAGSLGLGGGLVQGKMDRGQVIDVEQAHHMPAVAQKPAGDLFGERTTRQRSSGLLEVTSTPRPRHPTLRQAYRRGRLLLGTTQRGIAHWGSAFTYGHEPTRTHRGRLNQRFTGCCTSTPVAPGRRPCPAAATESVDRGMQPTVIATRPGDNRDLPQFAA